MSYPLSTTNFQVKRYDPVLFVTKMRHDLHGFLPRAVRGLRERGGVNVPNSMMMTLAYIFQLLLLLLLKFRVLCF